MSSAQAIPHLLDAYVDLQRYVALALSVLSLRSVLKIVLLSSLSPEPDRRVLRLGVHSALAVLATYTVHTQLRRLLSTFIVQCVKRPDRDDEFALAMRLTPHSAAPPSTGDGRAASTVVRIYLLESGMIFVCCRLGAWSYASRDQLGFVVPVFSLAEILASVAVLAELRFLFFRHVKIQQRLLFFLNDLVYFVLAMVQRGFAFLILVPAAWAADLFFLHHGEPKAGYAYSKGPTPLPEQIFRITAMLISFVGGLYATAGLLIFAFSL